MGRDGAFSSSFSRVAFLPLLTVFLPFPTCSLCSSSQKRHLVEHHSNPYASTRGVKIGITPSALRQLLGEEGYQASLAAQEAEKRRAEKEKQAQAESARAALAQRVAEAAEARAKAEMEREEQRVVEELENEEQEDLESLVAMQEQDQEKAGEAAISDGRPA